MVYKGKLQVHMTGHQIQTLDDLCAKYNKKQCDVFREGLRVLSAFDEELSKGRYIAIRQVTDIPSDPELVIRKLQTYFVKDIPWVPSGGRSPRVQLALGEQAREMLTTLRQKYETSYNNILKAGFFGIQLVATSYAHGRAIVSENKSHKEPRNIVILGGYGHPPIYNPNQA